MRVQDLLAHIETVARPDLAASWDQSGIQIAGTAQHITKMAVTLDAVPATVTAALDWGAEFILTHHPLSLKPTLPSACDAYHRILRSTLEAGVWMYAAHTSLDAQPNGPVAWLADALGLQQRSVVSPSCTERARVYQIHGLSNGSGLEELPGVFDIRQTGTSEWEVTAWPQAEAAISALPARRVHVQEALHPCKVYGFGCAGRLATPVSAERFTEQVAALLNIRGWNEIGLRPETLSTVAYCPGSGADFASAAFGAGADVFLTGDVKYHQAQQVESLGWTLDVGHFSLEEHMMSSWAERLSEEFLDEHIAVAFFPGNNPLTLSTG